MLEVNGPRAAKGAETILAPYKDPMEIRDTFLREHAAVHRRSVGQSPYGVDWLLEGLDEAQFRAQPFGLNSLAWLLWHIASVEDTHVAPVVFGAPPLLDGALATRLGVEPTSTYAGGAHDVERLSNSIHLPELLAYRDAVGHRTRALAVALPDARWAEPVAEMDLGRGAEAGHLSGEERHLIGTPRDALLFWWAISHSTYHLGQCAMMRRVLATPVGGE